uniref:Uncharacterized protein n=1 Tax=Alexandrium catenella TaxID=2925 RepID=A0A7S1L148_ALECA|mmetsp:Transcript_104594/g.278307  ORF Transcript_104594/g.278307 Transcript_104594/m.278307 type:complete len:226 (+) Transcript_104594:1-678(+)
MLASCGQRIPSWTPPQILEDRCAFTPLPQLPLACGQPPLGAGLADGSPMGSPVGQAPPLGSPHHDSRGSSAFLAPMGGAHGQGPSITTMPGGPDCASQSPQSGVAMSPQMNLRGVRMPGPHGFGQLSAAEFPPQFMRPSLSLPGPLGSGGMMGSGYFQPGAPHGGNVVRGSMGSLAAPGGLGGFAPMGSAGTAPGPFTMMAQNSDCKGALGAPQPQPGMMVAGGA